MEIVELQEHAQRSADSGVILLEKDKTVSKNNSVTLYVGTKVRKLCFDVNYLKIEVVMFLYMFSLMARNVTNTVLIIEKVCLVHLGRTESECSRLNDKSLKDLKNEVEKIAMNYHVGQALITMAPSAVLSLFIGSWSDKYGRKAPIIVALVGIMIDDFGAILCSYFLASRVEYMYITAIFTGMSGGFIGVLMVLYAYASDISSTGNRTLRYALMEMAFGLSRPLGLLAGGWINKFFRFVPVFAMSFCGHFLGLLWVVCILEETRGLGSLDSWSTKFRSFWSTESMTGAFKATIKKRSNKGREQIWALILAMSISVFAFVSAGSIGYLYVHHQFSWDNATYSTVSSIFSVIGIVVMLIVVPLSKKYQVREVVLGIIGSISLVAKMICTGLAADQSLYFLACFLGLFTSLSTLACRSKISKIAPKEDLGKVFAFLTTAESILPIAATAIVSQVYNASLHFFPGLVFVMMGSFSIVPVLIFVWIARLPSADYERLSERPEKERHLDVSL